MNIKQEKQIKVFLIGEFGQIKELCCEELCRLFCDVDNITYGGLKKLGFSRTKALGYGKEC